MNNLNRQLVSLVAIAALFLFTAGCSEQKVDPKRDAPAQHFSETAKPVKEDVATEKGNTKGEDKALKIQVKVVPNPAKILKENIFRVTLSDAKGNPVEDASVIIALSMPGMDHGDIHFSAESEGKGVYIGKGIPVMVGSWVADVKANVSDHTTLARYSFKATR